MTNVDVARHVERDSSAEMGEGILILNPAEYQLELEGGHRIDE